VVKAEKGGRLVGLASQRMQHNSTFTETLPGDFATPKDFDEEVTFTYPLPISDVSPET
jgi:hypothetical protein